MDRASRVAGLLMAMRYAIPSHPVRTRYFAVFAGNSSDKNVYTGP